MSFHPPAITPSAPTFSHLPFSQLPFSRQLTHRLLWGNNCRHNPQKIPISNLVTLSRQPHVEDRRGIWKSETRCSRWLEPAFHGFEEVGMGSGSVGFPSLWATGLGRSGIGPEAGGGEGRWAGGGSGGKLRRWRTCFPPSPGVGRSHVRDAGEPVMLCPARRSGAPSWGG